MRYRQQRLRETEDAIDTALQLAPDRLDSLRQLGWILVAQQRLGHAELAFLRAQEHAPNDPVVWLELAQVRLRADQLPPAWPAWTPCGRWGRCRHRRSCCKRACWWKAVHSQPAYYTQALALCRRLLAQPSLQGEVAALLVRLRGLGVDAARPLRHAATLAMAAQLPAGHEHRRHPTRPRLSGPTGPISPAGVSRTTLAGPGLPVCRQPVGPGQPGASGADGPPRLAGAETAQRPVHRLGHTPAPSQPGSRLRLAYVASQSHGRLLQRVLASHDPAQVEVFVYSQQPLGDLPAHVHEQPLEPAELASACAANQIDILIDAGGLQPFEGQYALLGATRNGWRQCKWPGWAAGAVPAGCLTCC